MDFYVRYNEFERLSLGNSMQDVIPPSDGVFFRHHQPMGYPALLIPFPSLLAAKHCHSLPDPHCQIAAVSF